MKDENAVFGVTAIQDAVRGEPFGCAQDRLFYNPFVVSPSAGLRANGLGPIFGAVASSIRWQVIV